MRLDLTQASYESIYRTKAVEPSQAKDLFENANENELEEGFLFTEDRTMVWMR
jgi:hypothetical protein